MAPKRSLSIWVPFALCLLLTGIATSLVGVAERDAQAAHFEEYVVEARDRIEERMAIYVAMLRAASGLLSTDRPVDPEDFRRFVARLQLAKNDPGTQGIGYSARFGAMDVASATSRARALGWTNVTVWPDTPREEVHAIVLLEPLDARNRAAIGYDMHTEAVRREAMDRARDSGHITLSGKVTLVQEIEEEKQSGFLLYAPLYEGGVIPEPIEDRRSKLKGYVYAPLRARDLFEGILGPAPLPVAFDLYDGDAIGGDALLYSTGPPIDPRDRPVVHTFSVAHHDWTARFVPVARSPGAFALTRIVLALGFVLSGIVLATTLVIERVQAREVKAVASAIANERLVRMKDMFIGTLGHDLRNPLNAIALASQLLERESQTESSRKALARVRNSTARMGRMIEQLLDATRVGLGGGIPVVRRDVLIDAVVRDVVDEVARAHPGCRIELAASGDLRGRWDADRLAQIFSNLVGNAARYTEGAPITVELDGRASDRVVARVRNAGVIPKAIVPMIFDPFRSGETPKRGSSGLGLGLYITRALVEAHGGSVEVVSNEGAGTTFTVRLPRGFPPAAGDVETPRAA